MGGPNVVSSAMLQCTFGAAPASLTVLPDDRVMVEGRPAATVMDNVSMVNIPTFGMCMSLSNPQVAAATAAALGVLTPMPCVPVIAAPWSPGAAKTMIAGKPALTAGAMTNCTWGGVVSVTVPGAVKTITN